MPINRRTLMGGALGATLIAATGARAAQWGDPPTPAEGDPKAPAWPPTEHIGLGPGRPPGSPATRPTPNNTMNGPAAVRELWLRGVADPVVGVYRPEKPDGRAVLSIPGGGYNFVSVQNEGIDVATALTRHGITVFVLAYRLPGEGWANRADVPLQDALRAMRLIRANAGKYAIDPARLGLVGFSAGGHLGGMVAVGFNDPVYAPIDAADDQSARPAYAGLVYPAMSFVSAGFESRASNGLWGDTATAGPEIVRRHTPLDRIGKDTPPICLVHAIDDGTVPIRQSIATLEACLKHKVPVESYFFEKGGHGFGGLHLPPDASGRLWTDSFARWTALH